MSLLHPLPHPDVSVGLILSLPAQDIDVASTEPIQSFLSLYIDHYIYNSILLYSILFKGIRSFVFVPWMQRQ